MIIDRVFPCSGKGLRLAVILVIFYFFYRVCDAAYWDSHCDLGLYKWTWLPSSTWHLSQTTDTRALRKFMVFQMASNCHSCSQKYRAYYVTKAVPAVDLTHGRGHQTWPQGLPGWWWAWWWCVSWPHHSRKSDQWLWQRGFNKALGGRGKPTTRCHTRLSFLCRLRGGHLIATVEVRHLQPNPITNIQPNTKPQFSLTGILRTPVFFFFLQSKATTVPF